MEAEGLEYGDKDTFLTSAYRQKLEERKIMEEELKEAARKEGVLIEPLIKGEVRIRRLYVVGNGIVSVIS